MKYNVIRILIAIVTLTVDTRRPRPGGSLIREIDKDSKISLLSNTNIKLKFTLSTLKDRI